MNKTPLQELIEWVKTPAVWGESNFSLLQKASDLEKTEREYWKETLQEESKQNAIEFLRFKEDYIHLTGGYYCLKKEVLSPNQERMWNLTELYDLFIKHKIESK